MTANYLQAKITERLDTEQPSWGMTKDGYTLRVGAPTSVKIRLEGERRWRRLMVWQFSNASTLFVRIKGQPFIVRDHDVPASHFERYPNPAARVSFPSMMAPINKRP